MIFENNLELRDSYSRVSKFHTILMTMQLPTYDPVRRPQLSKSLHVASDLSWS
jgi:hypothetical protein